jgi:hypothetical protein
MPLAQSLSTSHAAPKSRPNPVPDELFDELLDEPPEPPMPLELAELLEEASPIPPLPPMPPAEELDTVRSGAQAGTTRTRDEAARRVCMQSVDIDPRYARRRAAGRGIFTGVWVFIRAARISLEIRK